MPLEHTSMADGLEVDVYMPIDQERIGLPKPLSEPFCRVISAWSGLKRDACAMVEISIQRTDVLRSKAFVYR